MFGTFEIIVQLSYFDAPLSTLHPTIDGALQSPAVWFTASNIPCRVPFKVLFFHGKEKNSAGVRRGLYGGWSSVVTPIFTSNSETINMVRFGTLPWFKIKVLNIFFSDALNPLSASQGLGDNVVHHSRLCCESYSIIHDWSPVMTVQTFWFHFVMFMKSLALQ